MLHAPVSDTKRSTSTSRPAPTADAPRLSAPSGKQAPLGTQDHVGTESPISPSAPVLQRECACGGADSDGGRAKCKENRAGLLGGRTDERVPSAWLGGLHSPGQLLDPATRVFMERRFGQNFGAVRVHTGAKASESAAAVNAPTHTSGPDMILGGGRFEPYTMAGTRLLAHEFAETVQQTSLPAAVARQVDDQPTSNVTEQQPDQAQNAVTNEVAPGGDTGQQQPTDPSQTPGDPTTGRADCPVSAELSSFAVGLGEGKGCNVNCRPATGNSGTGRLAHFRLTGLPAGPSNVTIGEQFKTLEENPQGIGALLQPQANTAVNGFFDDCYCIESPNPLPPDFRLKTEQNHLLNGAVLDKNQITFTADGIRFCHFDRLPGSCSFGARCKL